MTSNSLQFNAVAVRLASGRQLFAFPIDGKHILDIATVARVRRSDDGNLSGFQRDAVKRHIDEIARYVQSTNAMIPNAVVIAFDRTVHFRRIATGSDGEIGEFGVLQVPVYEDEEKRPGWIVDGQQRTYAIQRAPVSSFPIMVCAFIEPDADVQAEHFVNVNSTKALPRALVSELLPHLAHVPERLTKKAAASRIAQRLAFDDDSPLKGHVRTQTAKQGVIMLNSLIQPIEALFGEPTGYVGSRVDFEQRLTDVDVDGLVVEMKEYWGGVKQVFEGAWGLKSTKSRLMHGVGIWAISLLMNKVFDDLEGSILADNVANRSIGLLRTAIGRKRLVTGRMSMGLAAQSLGTDFRIHRRTRPGSRDTSHGNTERSTMARASINRDSDVAMIRNPLSDEQCKTMFELSSYAKKHDLLDGFRRKALFQAGRFKEWFPTRVGLLLGALKELIPDLPERSESDLIERTREILSVMETLDLAEMSFSHVGYGDGYTAEALRRGYSEGLVSPQERLLLAELLEDQGKLAEAREVATALIADFPKNLTVQRLCSRLEVGRQTTARAKIGKSAAAVRAKRVMAVGREAKVSSATVAVGRIASAKQKATATSGIPLSRRSVGSKRTN